MRRITRKRCDLPRGTCCIYCGKPLWHSRFWLKVDKENGPTWNGSRCWLWIAGTDKLGYGRFGHPKEPRMAYAVAFELAGGTVPKGYDIDHLCRNTRCVNPRHLEAVPKHINVRRGISQPAMNARKTHCMRGHELSGNNLIIITRRDGRPSWRKCKECLRMLTRKWRDQHPNYQREWKKKKKGTP